MSHEYWVPTDILVEFMLKLPVKSLLRCKSVCKRWYSLISSKLFIKSHLTLAPSNTRYRLISINDYLSCCIYDLETFGESFNVFELDNPFTCKHSEARIVGSCNGLLCITRRVNSLPRFCRYGWFSHGSVDFGFGYDESNDDYKVVANYCADVQIYSLKSGCWKTLGKFPRGYPRRAFGMFFNGAIHWTGYRDGKSSNDYFITIVSFNLATETFGEILQPVYDKGHNYLTVCTLGEWLCVVCDYRGNRSDVWVMKVYGVQDSWTKLVSIPHVTYISIPKFLMPLCISHDKKLLLKLQKLLVLYDSENSSFSKIQKFDHGFKAHTYVESLVSPMPFGASMKESMAFWTFLKLLALISFSNYVFTTFLSVLRSNASSLIYVFG